ncbi:uncharacterized protein PHALS_13216 [Plasmopara halstedii]|uniref:Uncharacterized protein n=1 Tax=Plasmopara halstedii TaxID=4781 RepID=A0A0P1ANB2_PLAHL|nr:uncharacterized protein PHALS_13216 [Plasmopara halstedii]CEG42986.1 hypothetical protein PHALS_13216 [Plasmopara halstedii]|eukprot:XP_024579355.1 hypothetical protein PHALS_13216 [Plasmopara halstedii]
MLPVFDANTCKNRHTFYVKQWLNTVLFCADGLKDLLEGDEPSQKRLESGDDHLSLDDDDDMKEEAYESLEICEDEDNNDDDDFTGNDNEKINVAYCNA